MESLLENFLLAMVAIVNPLGKVPVWVKASEGCDSAVSLRLAVFVTATALGLLLLFLLFGEALLGFLGIDLAAFRVGGGIIILLTGIEMLRGRAVDVVDDDADEEEDAFERAKARFRSVVVPISVPILAGPGSMTTAILFGSHAQEWTERMLLAAVLAGVMLVVLVTLLLGRRTQALVGDLVLQVQTRIWGLLLTAIAAQLILVGLGESFPSWIDGASPIRDDIQAGPGTS